MEKFRKELKALSGIKTPGKLFAFIENTIIPVFDLTHLGVFMLDDSEKKYVCVENIIGRHSVLQALESVHFDLDNPIIKCLSDSKKAVYLKGVDKDLEFAFTDERKASLTSLKNELNKLENRIYVPGFVDGRLLVILALGQRNPEKGPSAEELKFFHLAANKSAEIINNHNLLKKEIELFVNSIRSMNKQVEEKDRYTRGHSHRVEQFSVIMGKKLKDELDSIHYGEVILYYAAEFHDVGKINIPDSILKKEEALSNKEYIKMKEHPIESAKLIKPMKKWFGKTIIEAVIYHHENYDGSGYPYGKKGEEINILARIIRVADSFDAMIIDRPYRKAFVQHKALQELKNGRGKQFDPKVLDAFLEAYKEGLFKDILLSRQ